MLIHVPETHEVADAVREIHQLEPLRHRDRDRQPIRITTIEIAILTMIRITITIMAAGTAEIGAVVRRLHRHVITMTMTIATMITMTTRLHDAAVQQKNARHERLGNQVHEKNALNRAHENVARQRAVTRVRNEDFDLIAILPIVIGTMDKSDCWTH
jgi:hypothetical protein